MKHDERTPTLEEVGLTPDDVQVYDHDFSEYLDDPESMSAFMDEAFATGDARFVAGCLGVIAKSIGMTEIARRSGVSRQNLYDALTGKTTPRLDTFLAVVSAMGLRLSANPRDPRPAPAEREEAAAEAA